MKIRKIKTGFSLLLFSTIAFGTTWYLPIYISGGFAADADANYDNARAAFDKYQVANLTSKVAAGDSIVLQYSDGSVGEFTMGPPESCAAGHCTWGGLDPFNAPTLPKSRQGPIPSGSQPQIIGLSPGSILPTMSPDPTPETITFDLTPSVTVTQLDAISVVDSDSGDGGGDGDGDGSGGIRYCPGSCPPILEK